jgi:hypothetical protein
VTASQAKEEEKLLDEVVVFKCAMSRDYKNMQELSIV